MSGTLLVFRTGLQTLALPAGLTRQAVPLAQVLPLPGHTGALLGLISAGGKVVPLLNLSLLADLPPSATAPELALLCDIGGETLALPVSDVIGFVSDDDAPVSGELLSAEGLLGGYGSGGRTGRTLNPQALLARLREHLTPV